MDVWCFLLTLVVILCAENTEGSTDVNCTDEEFACEEGSRCIRPSWFCDGYSDCTDDSDEISSLLSLNSTENGNPCLQKNGNICFLPKNQQSKSNVLCTKNVTCTDEEFACVDGSRCIIRYRFCNGIKDCKDGSDEIPRLLSSNMTEIGIPCRRNERICLLLKNQHSKSSVLCTKDVNCTDEEFACEDGSRCIRPSWFCDGHSDCTDGSDEIPRLLSPNMTKTESSCRQSDRICLLPKNQHSKSSVLCTKDLNCTDEEFACEDGSGCFRPSWFCNGNSQCTDGSDEIPRLLSPNMTETGIPCRQSDRICLLPKNQHSKSSVLCTKDVNCTDEEFACEDSSGCIQPSNFCNGYSDCTDGSDEIPRLLSPNMTESGIPCRQNYNICLLPKNQYSKSSVLCTKDVNCTDEEFACVDGSQCHRKSMFCDGHEECNDGSDENPIQRKHLNEDIVCEGSDPRNVKPVMCALPKKYQCDGASLCKSGVDECLCMDGNWTSFLDKDCFRCFSHQYKVIPIGKLCDKIFDCPDMSDECLCKNDNSIPELCNLAVFVTTEYQNEDLGQSFLCDNGNTTISVNEEQICDGRSDCSNKVDESNCIVSAQENDHICEYQDSPLADSIRCNGKPECNYDRDEECDCDEIPRFCQNISKMISIPEYQFECFGDTLNTMSGWILTILCDGTDDCPMKEDELLCTNRTHFYCHDDPTSYVLIDQLCDQKADCVDESDELCEKSFRCFEKGTNGSGILYINRDKLCDGTPNCAGGVDECQYWCINSSFSTNSSLIKSKGVLGVLYTISSVALCGNILVFIITMRMMLCPSRKRRITMLPNHRRKKVIINRLLILSLSISDALVVIYTMAICIASSITEGEYCLVDQDWRSGSSCSALGALLLIGSEQSVFTMIIITVFRLYTIWRPLGFVSVRKCSILLAFTWIISISLGVIPLLPHLEDTFTTSIWYADNKLFSTIVQKDVKNITYWLLLMHVSSNKSHSSDIGSWITLEELIGEMRPNFTAQRRFGFYSSHTVCIPDFFPDFANIASWWYSLLLIIINFAGFLVIAIGYSLIYRRATKKAQVRNVKAKSELSSKMQKRLTVIIATDFLCWMPVCIMGFLQLSGIAIPADLRLVVGMIIIPINSALNPIIYSGWLSVFLERLKQFCERDIELNKRNEDEAEQRTQRVIKETMLPVAMHASDSAGPAGDIELRRRNEDKAKQRTQRVIEERMAPVEINAPDSVREGRVAIILEATV